MLALGALGWAVIRLGRDLRHRAVTVRRLRQAGVAHEGLVIADWDSPLAVAVPGHPGARAALAGSPAVAPALGVNGGVIVRRVNVLRQPPAIDGGLLLLLLAGLSAVTVCLMAGGDATTAFVDVFRAWLARSSPFSGAAGQSRACAADPRSCGPS